MANKTLPVINSFDQLAIWRNTQKSTLRLPLAPKIPWNFTGITKQGGNYLTWQSVVGADGYELQVSTNGDFSATANPVTVVMRAQQDTAYFDTVPTQGGTAPAKRWYRVRATSGTASQPHVTKGAWSGIVGPLSAIAPNDNVTASASSSDKSTTDKYQAGAGRGSYL